MRNATRRVALALTVTCCLVPLAAGSARAADLTLFETFGPVSEPIFNRDEGLAIDPASGDLLVIDAANVKEQQNAVFKDFQGGTYKMTLDNPVSGNLETTNEIAFSTIGFINNTNLSNALEELPGIETGDITVSGSGISSNRTQTVTFQGAFAAIDIPLWSCTIVNAGPSATCVVGEVDDGVGPQLRRFKANGEPRLFPATGTNVIDGRGSGDQTPQNSILGSALSPGEVQVAVAPPGSAGGTAGNIYLTSASNNLVDVFAASGEFLGQLTESAGGGAFGKVCGVAVDPSGALYVSDFSGEIHKFVPSANLPLPADSPDVPFPFAQACSIAAGAGPSAGYIFAAHFGGAVAKLDSSTGVEQYVVAPGVNTTVSVDRLSGRVVVASGNEVESYDASGATEATPLGSAVLASAIEGVAAHGDDVFVARASSPKVEVYLPLPDRAPVVTTGAAGPGANFSLATLAGEIDPQGFKVTECRFEYGPTSAYGISVPCDQGGAEIGIGTEPVAVTASTEPLDPNTTYHYRLVASNFSQGDVGDDREFTAGPSPGDDPCPNAAIRAQQGVDVLLLPDCMALEMVSPPVKNGQGARAPHISVDGKRIRFKSNAGLPGSPGVLSIKGDPYVATRDATEGWSTAHTVPPSPFARGWSYDESIAAAASLTPDFSCWFQLAGSDAQSQLGVARVFRGCLGGVFSPISPLLVPMVVRAGGKPNPDLLQESRFQAASADHSHLVFIPGPTVGDLGGGPTSYLPNDPTLAETPGASKNTYVALPGPAGEPSLELLARGRDGVDGKVKVWGGNCGTIVGGPENRNQGAVSSDGGRIYFSTRLAQPETGACSTAPKLRILERLEGAGGPTIRPLFSSQCDRVAPPCSGVDGDDLYQGSSVDGTRVYFMTNRQLADTDLDEGSACSANLGASTGCDLYLYDAAEPLGQRLVQVSAGEDVAANVAPEHEAGKGAGALDGIVAISGDGSHVYFVARGALTGDENPEGRSADQYPAATPKLYLYQRDEGHPDGRLAFVGALDPADNGMTRLWGGRGTFTNSAYPVPVTAKAGGVEVGGDGHVLFLISAAPLTADDTDNSARDLYRYDAELDQLQRLSRASAGGDDGGPFSVAGRGMPDDIFGLGTDFAEVGRWASEDGQTAVFTTAEGLLPGDQDGSFDQYLWRAGELVLLPGSSGERATTSHDGSSIAFDSRRALLPQDGDSARDIYVARVDGGFPNPVVKVPCQPDRGEPGPHCRGESAAAPSAPSSASAGLIGAGNPKPRLRPRCPKGKRRVVRKGKVRCVRQKKKRRAQKGKKTQLGNLNRRAGK